MLARNMSLEGIGVSTDNKKASPGTAGLSWCPVSADTLAPVLSRETQSQALWVGPETVASPGAAASAGAHYSYILLASGSLAPPAKEGLKGPESERWAALTTEPGMHGSARAATAAGRAEGAPSWDPTGNCSLAPSERP